MEVLKQQGALIARISMGDGATIIYVEVRERENHEVAIEMYTAAGAVFKHPGFMSTVHQAFLCFDHETSSVDYSQTILNTIEWLQRDQFTVLGYESTCGSTRTTLAELERAYMKPINLAIAIRQIIDSFTYSAKDEVVQYKWSQYDKLDVTIDEFKAKLREYNMALVGENRAFLMIQKYPSLQMPGT